MAFQKAGSTKWALAQLNYLDLGGGPGSPSVDQTALTPFVFNGANNNVGVGKDPDANKLSVAGNVKHDGERPIKNFRAGNGLEISQRFDLQTRVA